MRGFPPVGFSKTGLHHLKVDIVSVNKDHPKYPVVLVKPVALDVNGLVQDKAH